MVKKLYELTEEQKRFYAENGYLCGLPPVFTPEEMNQLNEEFKNLLALLEPDEKMHHMREWHMESKWLYDICAHPQILNYVEGILGPNFYMWGSEFFGKEPRSNTRVAWHQDAYYWPLSPHHSVTVWLAFTDVDIENGAMQVIPGTHNKGLIKHRRVDDNSILTLELEEGTFNAADAVTINLKAGEISLHDDNIVHGSPPNVSDRWRIGLTIRYSGTHVKCDLTKGPKFKQYMMRGVDEYRHNPYGTIPTQTFGRLPKDFYDKEHVK